MAYEIFISYRRSNEQLWTNGTEIARSIKQQLELCGYRGRIFFDYSVEEMDDYFETVILSSLEKCKLLILVLSRDSMGRVVNDGDWVRREVLRAKQCGLKIIPVDPDKQFDGFPAGLPEELSFLPRIQRTVIHMDEGFENDIDRLIERRIKAVVPPSGTSYWGRYGTTIISAIVAVGVVMGFALFRSTADPSLTPTTESDTEVLADGNVTPGSSNQEKPSSKVNHQEEFADAQRKKDEEAKRQQQLEEQRKKEEEAKRSSALNIEMVYVAGGTFMMGASLYDPGAYGDERPAHSVTLSGYYIGRYEVTQKQWVRIMGSNPSRWKGDNLPVENVSWEDIQEFLRKLNARTGKNYRLPTEAEWEFAARGGNSSCGYKYSGSDNIGNVAWYKDNSGSKTHPVGTQSPNELGIYDMAGNVYEWCQDWYDGYSSAAQTNPTGPSSGALRVLRGGSCFNYAKYCRVSSRYDYAPGSRFINCGFRLATSL